MQCNNNEKGFTYLEVIFAILIMTIGILAALSAISLAVLRERESDQKNVARQITSATLESIFATRDLRSENPLSNWDAVTNKTSATPQGVFLTGWCPVRDDAGIDGIQGTADDACAAGTSCVVNGYTNSSTVMIGFERQVTFTDIVEGTNSNITKRRVDVSVRYYAGQALRTETVSTIIADLPFAR